MYRAVILVFLGAAIASGCDSSGENRSAPAGTETAAGRSDATTEATIDRAGDQLLAEGAVLTTADLGSGWQINDLSEDPVAADEAECFAFRSSDLIVTAEAQGDTLVLGDPTAVVGGKVFVRGTHVVTSFVTVYATEEQAVEAYSRANARLRSRETAACLERADEVPEGPRIRRLEGRPYNPGVFPELAEQTKAGNWQLEFEQEAGAVLLDVAVMREGRALECVVLSSVALPQLVDPFTAEDVIEVVKIAAGRLTS